MNEAEKENEREEALIKEGKCPVCEIPVKITDFKDQFNVDEYKKSGLCQTCQDATLSEFKGLRETLKRCKES